MAIAATSTINPNKTSNHYALTAMAGAGAGMAARYVMPAKAELSNALNKDTFTSTAKMAQRAEGRSILKYAGLGALIATGAKFIYNAVKNNSEKNKPTLEYSKMGALIDAPDYACEIMWYGE